jgi:DNA-binding transcriptional LysR family regulator
MLEDELGAPLLERTPRGVRLLPSGERFLAHARGILRAVDEAAIAARPGSA